MIKFKANSPFNILYDVPYFPLKEPGSSWYYAMKMIVKAHDPSGKLAERFRCKRMSDTIEYRYKAPHLTEIRDIFCEHGFGELGLQSDFKLNIRNVFSLLKKYGPLHFEGEVYTVVIVGCNQMNKSVSVHFLLPKAYEKKNGNISHSERFFQKDPGATRRKHCSNSILVWIPNIMDRKDVLWDILFRLEVNELILKTYCAFARQNMSYIKKFLTKIYSEEVLKNAPYLKLNIEELTKIAGVCRPTIDYYIPIAQSLMSSPCCNIL